MSAVRTASASSPPKCSLAKPFANASGTVNHRRFYCPLHACRTRLSQGCPVRPLLQSILPRQNFIHQFGSLSACQPQHIIRSLPQNFHALLDFVVLVGKASMKNSSRLERLPFQTIQCPVLCLPFSSVVILLRQSEGRGRCWLAAASSSVAGSIIFERQWDLWRCFERFM